MALWEPVWASTTLERYIIQVQYLKTKSHRSRCTVRRTYFLQWELTFSIGTLQITDQHMVSTMHMVFYWERLVGLVIVHLVVAEGSERAENRQLQRTKMRDKKSKDQKKLLWLKHNREEWLISQGQLHPGTKTFITSHTTRGAVGQDLNTMRSRMHRKVRKLLWCYMFFVHHETHLSC